MDISDGNLEGIPERIRRRVSEAILRTVAEGKLEVIIATIFEEIFGGINIWRFFLKESWDIPEGISGRINGLMSKGILREVPKAIL